MGKATSRAGKGRGWHLQRQRHSNARRLGRAGGTYATKGYYSKRKDFDKDGVPNIKDCRPFNPDMQDEKKYPNLRFDEKGKVTGIRVTKDLKPKEADLYIQHKKPEIHKDLHKIVDKSMKHAKTPEHKEKLKQQREKIKHVKDRNKLKKWLKDHADIIGGITGAGIGVGVSFVGGATSPMIQTLVTLGTANLFAFLGYGVGVMRKER